MQKLLDLPVKRFKKIVGVSEPSQKGNTTRILSAALARKLGDIAASAGWVPCELTLCSKERYLL